MQVSRGASFASSRRGPRRHQRADLRPYTRILADDGPIMVIATSICRRLVMGTGPATNGRPLLIDLASGLRAPSGRAASSMMDSKGQTEGS